MLMSKKGVVLFLLLCGLSRSFGAGGHDHGNHEGHDHDDHDDHDDHTGHDHTGGPHGHGDTEENCPEDDHHDHGTHESQGGDHDDHDHDDHDHHGHDDDPHNHMGHGHDEWDGKEGDCPATELNFDGESIYYQIMEKTPLLSDITFCTYFTTNSNGVAKGVIASIHTDQKYKNFIIVGGMGITKPFIRFILGSRRRKIPTNFQANKEVHMCMVSTVADNTVKVYFAGKKEANDLVFPQINNIPRGIFRIGRSKDDKYPMYRGTLRNLILWGKPLTDEEIAKIYNNNYCPGEAIIIPLKSHIIPLKANVPTEACPKIAYTIDNTGDKVEYLEIGGSNDTTEYLTVCVQVTTNSRGIVPGTIASYGTEKQPELISGGGELGKDGKAYTRYVVAGQTKLMVGRLAPNTSYRFCMVYHMPNNHQMTYINGILNNTITFDDISELPGGGTIIVGQRQRKFGGCFDRKLALNGKIEDFMIWNRAFSEVDIAAYAAGKCPVDAAFTTKRNEVIPHGRFYEYGPCPSTEFTLNNKGKVQEYIDITNSLPESEYITVCAKIVTDENGMIPGIVGSYSTESEKNSISVGGKMGQNGPQLLVTLNGDTMIADAQFAPTTEYRFCISFHTDHGHALTYINGKFSRDMHFHDAHSVPGGGKIIVGQHQNCPGGCFDRSLAYNGKISEFMVWNRVLSLEEMGAIAEKGECPTDQIVDLSPGNAKKVTSTISI